MSLLTIHKVLIGVLLSFIILSCSTEDEGFKEYLYLLTEVNENDRQKQLTDRILEYTEFPIIEGNKVYFIYQNPNDVSVYLIGDMNSWSQTATSLLKIIGTDYYYAEAEFEPDSRIEYKFLVSGEAILDPLNGKTSAGGFGKNSLLMMPEYEFPTEVLANRFQQYTQLDTIRFKSKLLKNTRNVFFYKHANATDLSPLIIFHDGEDYLKFANANIILDNLTHQNKMPACQAVFINPVDRLKEQMFDDNYLQMIFNELLPFLKNRYKFREDVSLAMGGVSLGGLCSFYAIKNYSDKLHFVFSQSGAFWVNDLQITRELKQTDLSNLKIFFDYGKYENQDSAHFAIDSLLTRKKATFSFKTYNEGHAWGNWKGHLDNALIYLFKNRKSS